jgi:hypothetical protein
MSQSQNLEFIRTRMICDHMPCKMDFALYCCVMGMHQQGSGSYNPNMILILGAALPLQDVD